MKKKVTVPVICVILIVGVVLGTLYVIDHKRMDNNQPVVFSTWGKQYAPPVNDYPTENGVNPDDEQSFVGTVLDETRTYMIVEPAEDEYERTVADKIKIEYGTEHHDYLYGIGRKVVIYYKGGIEATEPALIKTDDISAGGFREWTLKVTPSKEPSKKKIISKWQPHESTFGWHRQYNLYYYGLEEVEVEVDGKCLTLEQAINRGMIATPSILSRANQDVSDGVIEELTYDDGGSRVYKYPDYTIVKYHTLDGNDDMYIGIPDMDITVADK